MNRRITFPSSSLYILTTTRNFLPSYTATAKRSFTTPIHTPRTKQHRPASIVKMSTLMPTQKDTTAAQTQNTNDPTDLIESAKRAAAKRAVNDYFNVDMRYVGIGSGTTIQYVVEAIKEIAADKNILYVPTGFQSRNEIEKRGLVAIDFNSLPESQLLDVAFDGADEVDEDFNCVKGGGACLFQEKLVAMRAKKFVCVADYRKDVPRLLTDWSYIPIEIAPIAAKTVLKALRELGSPNPVLRTLEPVKAGALKTDQDFYIVKAPFPPLLVQKDNPVAAEMGAQKHGKTKDGDEGRVWGVEELALKIKAITGVLEVGLFYGLTGPQALAKGAQGGQKPVAFYIGQKDGSVKVRKIDGEE